MEKKKCIFWVLSTILALAAADTKQVRVGSILIKNICDDGITSTSVVVKVNTNPETQLSLPTVQQADTNYTINSGTRPIIPALYEKEIFGQT